MVEITFVASLPPIQSAITLAGNGDGARVRLEIPGTEVPEVLKLVLLTGQAFTVTIRAIPSH